MANVDDILEQCLEEVVSGRSTVDDCLADYPQYADVLRALVQTALEIDGSDRPEPSRAAYEAGKQLMAEAAARRARNRAPSRGGLSESITRSLAFLKLTGGAGATVRRLAVVGTLGAATLLVWLGVTGLLLRAWYGSMVPQTCVVADASGIAQVQTSPGGAWQPLVMGGVLQSGQRIRTGSPARVTLRFLDGGSTSLGPDSELLIAQMRARRDGSSRVVVVEQVAGTTYNRVGGQEESALLFQINTPSASVIVHGTEFEVDVGLDNSTSVVVIEGEVAVTGQQVTVVLTDGDATMVRADQAPEPVVLAPSEEWVEEVSGEEPSPQVPETQASAEPGTPGGTPESDESVREPTATGTTGGESPVPASPEAPVVTETATSTSEAVRAATPTATSQVPVATATPKPPTPTVTPRPPTATPTPEPAPPTATAVPSPSPRPAEVVEVFQVTYKVSKGELRVKARTSLLECTLTLVGFGPMVPEGGHWLYVEESLNQDDVPSAVTVRSSCGGSGTSAVQWE
jgi:hypothetical protein